MPVFSAKRARWLRCVGCAAVGVCLCIQTTPLQAAVKAKPRAAAKKVVPLTPWEQAEQSRDALEAIPEASRTRADYTRTLERYRAIYHAHPGDIHAAESIYVVADLLAEQGRLLSDARASQSAVGQYEFLRKQYPGSSLRIPALLAEGQINQNDLHDLKAAHQAYDEFLRRYPHSEHAEEARAALAAIDRPVSKPGKNARTGRPSDNAADTPIANPATRSTGKSNPQPVTASISPVAVAMDDPSIIPAKPGATRHAGGLAMVTAIRHWSTPTYTRVAIDLGDEVQYEAARVPNPDRIYFDLHGTRLAQELAGKNFLVTDDGFLKRIRIAQFSNEMTRVVLDVNDVTEYSAFLLPNPYRLIIDIHGTRTATTPVTIGPAQAPAKPAKNAATVPNTVATRQVSSAEVEDVSEQPGKVVATKKPTSRPISAVVDDAAGNKDTGIRDQGSGFRDQGAGMSTAADASVVAALPPSSLPGTNSLPSTKKSSTRKSRTTVSAAAPAPAALPTADGQTSLVRALGLKVGRIVIDAGHGGHDSGTLGVDGIQEKDVVLDVALRLGRMLHDRLGSEIIYTRADDTFIPLETRTAIANKAQADLFISVHANSSRDETARGVETYYLNFTSEPDALDVAARENAVSTQSMHELSDMVKKIALKEKIDESREFASDVEQSLYSGLESGNAGLKNRGVKKAPFVVLIGANMPSILAEISFVTNPRDAEQLQRPDYRQRVAESLYKGVARYAGGLSGLKTPVERASGQ